MILWTTKAAELYGEEMTVEMEEREWTHSCGFLARLPRIFDNFDPTLFKRTNILAKSENRGNLAKREDYTKDREKGKKSSWDFVKVGSKRKRKESGGWWEWNRGKKEKWETWNELERDITNSREPTQYTCIYINAISRTSDHCSALDQLFQRSYSWLDAVEWHRNTWVPSIRR